MLDLASLILMLSVLMQAVAAVLALRLNWVYGWRWAWTLISVAITLMTVRRALTLFQIVMFGEPATMLDEEHTEDLFAALPASVSLLVSLLILAGVALIAPIFSNIARAEQVLRAERDGLQQFVSAKEAEFQIAQQIQQSLLPKEALQLGKLEVAGLCWPATETAGDYYDYFVLPNGKLLVLIADVSGHGLGPALVMAETRAWVSVLAKTESDPGKILNQLNKLLTNETSDIFVTMFIATMTPHMDQFVYASAGHPAFLLGSHGERELKSDGIPLGINFDASFESSESIKIKQSELLFLATDGLFEAFSMTGEPFGVDRPLALIRESRHMSPLEIVGALNQQVRKFSGDRLHDDLTMLVVKNL